MNKLLNCPFCDSDNVVDEYTDVVGTLSGSEHQAGWVECGDCGATGPTITAKDEKIKDIVSNVRDTWNKPPRDSSPYSIIINFEEGFWTAEIRELGIHWSAETYAEILKMANVEFEYFMNFYRNTDDSELTNGAIEMKRRFLSLL